ncbi:MAG TPA: TIGR00730 family Rossman fold protein [Candidatus Nanoarchaeia archaeon]|nr:TIGR00730 family Rossman fold protein [Candidatus Nanoarchaeia archaeon]
METDKEKKQHKGKDRIEVTVPMSRAAMQAAAQDRIKRINSEFEEGFNFLENYQKSVTVFGSSVVNEDNEFYKMAMSLCKRISSELKCAVVTGGGPGIMEAANRGAYEAEGQSLGITIKLPREQVTNPYLTDQIALQYFFARKVLLSFSAEVFLFFPGGYGTLDELFEILTLVQTRKIRSIPIVLVGSEYWKPFEKFLFDNILSRGMIDDADISLFTIEDNEDKILDLIRNAPERNEY